MIVLTLTFSLTRTAQNRIPPAASSWQRHKNPTTEMGKAVPYTTLQTFLLIPCLCSLYLSIL